MDKVGTNVLIAEFMGITLIRGEYETNHNQWKWGNDGFAQGQSWYSTNYFEPDELLYDTSWDWLVPVIQKIDELGFNVIISRISCKVCRISEEDYPIVSWVCGNIDDKIGLVYKTLVQFIKWYKINSKTK